MDVVFAEEVDCEDPGARTNYLVDPFAVSEDVASFFLVHYDLALLLDGLLVATDSDDEVDVRKELFCLL